MQKDFDIHNRTASGLDHACIPSITAILSKLEKFLQMPGSTDVTLLRCTPDTLVRTNENLAPLANIGTPEPVEHGYTDQQPLHIINLPSVHQLSHLLPVEVQPFSALRFRANVYLTGAPPYSEETWERYRNLPTVGRPHAPNAPQLLSRYSAVYRDAPCRM